MSIINIVIFHFSSLLRNDFTTLIGKKVYYAIYQYLRNDIHSDSSRKQRSVDDDEPVHHFLQQSVDGTTPSRDFVVPGLRGLLFGQRYVDGDDRIRVELGQSDQCNPDDNGLCQVLFPPLIGHFHDEPRELGPLLDGVFLQSLPLGRPVQLGQIIDMELPSLSQVRLVNGLQEVHDDALVGGQPVSKLVCITAGIDVHFLRIRDLSQGRSIQEPSWDDRGDGAPV